MRNVDIKGDSQDEADISERVLTEVEHGERCDDERWWVPHTFEVGFTEEI